MAKLNYDWKVRLNRKNASDITYWIWRLLQYKKILVIVVDSEDNYVPDIHHDVSFVELAVQDESPTFSTNTLYPRSTTIALNLTNIGCVHFSSSTKEQAKGLRETAEFHFMRDKLLITQTSKDRVMHMLYIIQS